MKTTTKRRSRSHKPRRRPRQVWKKQLAKREIWQNYTVSVIRNRKGRFVSWRKIVYGRPRKAYARRETAAREYARERLAEAPRGKALSIYGKAHVRKGRIHIIQSRRWELVKGSLSGREWRNAVGLARRYPPKQCFSHRPTYAEDLDPDEFEGEWVETPEIESR